MDDDKIELGAAIAQVTSLDIEASKKVELNFKHWHSKSQCISEWQKKDLECLRKFIDKVQDLTPSQIKTDGGLGYKLHKGAPKTRGFSRPSSISRDVALFELRLSGKARAHFYMQDEQLYIVWLDRNHDVFPE